MLEETVNKLIMKLKDILCDTELTDSEYDGLEEHLLLESGLYNPKSKSLKTSRLLYKAMVLLNEKIEDDPDIDAKVGLRNDYLFLEIKGPSPEAKRDIMKYVEMKFNVARHLAFKSRFENVPLNNYDAILAEVYKKLEANNFYGVGSDRAFELSGIMADQFLEEGIDAREYDDLSGITPVPKKGILKIPKYPLMWHLRKVGRA